jgi:D-alanine-D-alanine ligase
MLGSTHKKRVAVLRGGPSSEYDVSLRSGAGVLQALASSAYVTKDITISKNGQWLVDGFSKEPEQALLGVDVVFIALHGSYGEDGTVQRILERLHIPYTGSGSFASAIAMNKSMTKDHVKKKTEKVKMAPHIKVTRDGAHDLSQLTHTILNLFGPEYVVKPNDGGSSIGIKIVEGHDLFSTLEASLQDHEAVIVEKRIRGREATVGILEGFRNQEFYQLPEVEIVPPSKTSFFSADVKYTGETDEICPGRFSKEEKDMLLEQALLVHQVLGLRQYSRSDFIVANDGVYFLEVNTLPGLTLQSLFPKAIEAVGGSYKELVLHLLHSARVY